jgi:DNA mismatch repair protein MutS
MPCGTKAALSTLDDIPPITEPILADAPAAILTPVLTPMMTQYIEIKTANPDSLLFYRMGDFYELFFEDAELASRALGIVLTKRGKHQGADIPMCGVPVERSNEYLHRLIALGFRVAICEQLEDPSEARKRGAKSVVKRDVVRLVTAGTITEENLLHPVAANLLVAVTRHKYSDHLWQYGIAAMDISTGYFSVQEISALESPENILFAELARLEPRELIIQKSCLEEQVLKTHLESLKIPLTPIARDEQHSSTHTQRIAAFFAVDTLEGFGTFSPVELSAAALILFYIERTQRGQRPPIAPPKRITQSDFLSLDAATRANLEITRTLSGDRAGSLLASV